MFGGAVEPDFNYFGGVRKGKRSRGATDKVAIFGIVNQGVKMCTKFVMNTKAETLMPMIV